MRIHLEPHSPPRVGKSKTAERTPCAPARVVQIERTTLEPFRPSRPIQSNCGLCGWRLLFVRQRSHPDYLAIGRADLTTGLLILEIAQPAPLTQAIASALFPNCLETI